MYNCISHCLFCTLKNWAVIVLTLFLFCRLFAFDLIEGVSEDDCDAELLLAGYLTLVVDLVTALPSAHVMLCTAFAPTFIDVDSQNNCRITRSVI